jgi:hypothetical protein
MAWPAVEAGNGLRPSGRVDVRLAMMDVPTTRYESTSSNTLKEHQQLNKSHLKHSYPQFLA